MFVVLDVQNQEERVVLKLTLGLTGMEPASVCPNSAVLWYWPSPVPTQDEASRAKKLIVVLSEKLGRFTALISSTAVGPKRREAQSGSLKVAFRAEEGAFWPSKREAVSIIGRPDVSGSPKYYGLGSPFPSA